MNDYDMRQLGAPPDPHADQRLQRLQSLELHARPDPEFDRFAQQLAAAAGTPYAMVNMFTTEEQFFVGLATPEPRTGLRRSIASAQVGRTMPRDHGFCPYVVERRKPLPLSDACASPRFASNPVVWDRVMGVRTYLGAPLIDSTGTVLGTVCALGPQPQQWGREGLELIKTTAREAVKLIETRQQRY